MNPRKILIVDDHPIVCLGLSQLINQCSDLIVCGQAADDVQAMEAIADQQPDLVIVDVSLSDRSGLDLLKSIREKYPNLPTLVVSMHDESVYAERSLRAGARGYVMKHEATERVVLAIKRIFAGGVYLSDAMSTRLVNKLTSGASYQAVSVVESLSDRELEVFRLIGRGLSTRQIAEKLYLSIKTIETYREHIKDKMNLKNACELMHQAVQYVQNEHL